MGENSSEIKHPDFTRHLAELRARIIRIVGYVIFGMIVGWIFYDDFFHLINTPILAFLKSHGSKLLLTGIAEGFTLKMQVSFLIGLVLAMPIITCEIWGFISPALYGKEKRAVILVAPLSVFLFVGGVVASYLMLPLGIEWLAAQNPPNAVFMPAAGQSLLFILKMSLVFGIIFQMPVALMFLAKVGIISSDMLRSRWRHAIVIIAIIVAIATPSNDALTMTLMCIPMLFLYFLSISMIKMVGR